MFVKKHPVGKNMYYSLSESFRDGSGGVKHRYVQYLGSGGDYTPGQITEYIPQQPIQVLMPPKSGFIAEEKYDGVRSLGYFNKSKGFVFINRRGNLKNKEYPEFIGVEQKLNANETVLDGEIIAFNKKTGKDDFKLLSQRDHLKNEKTIKERSKEMPLTYMAFDVLEKNGEYVGGQPLEKRKEILDQVIPDNLKEIKEIKFSRDSKGTTKILSRDPSIEGVVYKKLLSPYSHKKNKDWLKKKFVKNNDVVVLGYTESNTGKRKGLIGSIICGVYDERHKKYRYVGNAGTGLNNKELREFTSKFSKIKTKEDFFIDKPKKKFVPIEPKHVFRIKFLKQTEKGIYREPVIVSERSDILPSQTHEAKV